MYFESVLRIDLYPFHTVFHGRTRDLDHTLTRVGPFRTGTWVSPAFLADDIICQHPRDTNQYISVLPWSNNPFSTLPYDPGLTQVQPCLIPELDCRFNLGYCWGVKGVLAFSLYIKEYIRAVPSGTICKLARKSPSWTQKSFQSNFFFTKIHLKNSPLKLTCKISYLSKTPDQNLH